MVKITNKKKALPNFSDIEAGDVFQVFGGEAWWMKIQQVGSTNCINLENGYSGMLTSESKIGPVAKSITIE